MFAGAEVSVVLPLLLIAAIFTYLTILDWQPALVLAVFFIAALTVPQWFNPSARRERRRHWTAIAELNSYFIDSLQGLHTQGIQSPKAAWRGDHETGNGSLQVSS